MSRRYDNSLEGPGDYWMDDRKCACCFIEEEDESTDEDYDEEDDNDGD